MKKFKIILGWMVLAIVVQSLVLFAFDRTYFATNSDVDVKKVEIQEDNSEKDANIPIPSNAEKLAFSFSGQYISYFQDKEMKIIDTSTGEEKKIETKNKVEYTSFQWLHDRNRIIVVGKDTGSKTNKLYSYDVDGNMAKEVDLSSMASNSIIEEISPSTKTGIIYIRTKTTNGSSSVYRIDNNDDVTKVSINTNKIEEISILPSQDRLVYETNKHNFYITQPNEQIIVAEEGDYRLLGIDDTNKMYICKVNNEGKAESILYKSINTSEEIKKSPWESIKLNTPVDVKNIYLDAKSSNVMVNDVINKKVININTLKENSYDGSIVGIYNNGFATIENDRLNKVKLK